MWVVKTVSSEYFFTFQNLVENVKYERVLIKQKTMSFQYYVMYLKVHNYYAISILNKIKKYL